MVRGSIRALGLVAVTAAAMTLSIGVYRQANW